MSDTFRKAVLNTTLAVGSMLPTAGCSTKQVEKPAEPQSVAVAGADAAPAAAPVQFDVRKDALSTKASALIDKDTKIAKFKFEVVDLPEGKRVQLDMLASQAYQVATVCTPEAGKEPSKLRAFALPAGDGKTIKVYKLRKDQEVQLRLFGKADDKEPLAVAGADAITIMKEGTPPNWMKPVFDKLDALRKDGKIKEGVRTANSDMLEHYDFPVVQNYLDAAKAGLRDDLKGTAMYLDGSVKEAMEASKAQGKGK